MMLKIFFSVVVVTNIKLANYELLWAVVSVVNYSSSSSFRRSLKKSSEEMQYKKPFDHMSELECLSGETLSLSELKGNIVLQLVTGCDWL